MREAAAAAVAALAARVSVWALLDTSSSEQLHPAACRQPAGHVRSGGWKSAEVLGRWIVLQLWQQTGNYSAQLLHQRLMTELLMLLVIKFWGWEEKNQWRKINTHGKLKHFWTEIVYSIIAYRKCLLKIKYWISCLRLCPCKNGDAGEHQ